MLTAHRVYGCIGAHYTTNKVGKNVDVVYSLNDERGRKLDRIIFRKAVGSREIILHTENRRQIKPTIECGEKFCVASFPHADIDNARKLKMTIGGKPKIEGELTVPILTRSIGGGQKHDPDKILNGMKDCGGHPAAAVFQDESDGAGGSGQLQ